MATRLGRGALLALLVAAVMAPAGPRPPAEVLDGEAVLRRQGDWWDNRDWDWYLERIPLLETPDPEIDATYYYRWEVVTKHLVYGSPEHGYTLTEFTDRPFWSGRYGAISCPLGHQLYEIRWLKDRRIVEDFAHYWFDVPGAEPRSYSNWYGDAVWAAWLVNGDRGFLLRLLPHMQEQVRGWVAERWDPEHRMFRWDGMHDGMETNINSRQTPEWSDGAEGYRPTLNSYLWADMTALSRALAVAGDDRAAAEYARRADALKARIQEELWDPEREFFLHQFAWQEETVAVPWPGEAGERADEAAVAGAAGRGDAGTPPIEPFSRTYESGPWAGDPHGRELIGYVPWQFGLPDPGYEAAWRSLTDPEGFRAEHGPTTVEQGDPLFYVSPRCCVWSGNSWPYATTQTLTAMARLLQDYDQRVVDRDDWLRTLRAYARTQRKDGRPYVAEAADPYTGSWEGHDKPFHSEHYLHSAYVDPVLSGLVGLRPTATDVLVVDPLAPGEWDWFAVEGAEIHGHEVTVLWDRDGGRYGRGAGLQVLVNGRRAAGRQGLGRLEVPLPAAPERQRPDRPLNYAVNNGRGHYPLATASSSRPEAPPAWAVDGQYWYHRRAANRWVPRHDRRGESWLAVDFGVERPVRRVKLHFLDDTLPVAGEVPGEGPAVAAPVAYRVEARIDGAWRSLRGERRPRRPEGRRGNVLELPEPVPATALRVVLEHAPGRVAGLSEIEAWGPGEPPLPPPTAPVGNVALNRSGTGFPRVTASHSAEGSGPELLNDGLLAFNHYTDRAWRATGSEAERDWIEIDLGRPRRIDGVDLYPWAWPDRGVQAPGAWSVQVERDGDWVEVRGARRQPPAPVAMARNRLAFEAVTTRRVRVWLRHAGAGPAAASEVVVWEAGAPR